MRLSKNFELKEFLITQHYAEVAPNSEQIANLKKLCETVLQPVRDYYNISIIITSGFRPPKVNELIGGSPTSQHLKGEAADFILAMDGLTWDAFIWIAVNLDFGQLIYYHEKKFIHVSLGTKKQIFISFKGGLYPMNEILKGA